ncbi:MAG: glycosyltransferase involved in cell wall biosynthesis [Verrucomicrobiales bacterium]|jgi:glycosyltransferase involved in cell wall biosynthesis
MKRWICSQIGAREHYAIPRALHREARLERLVTDLWFGLGKQRMLSKLGSAGRRLAGRWRSGIQDAQVSAFPIGGLRWAAAAHRKRGEDLYRLFTEQGAWFGKKTARILQSSPEETIFFSYDTGFLEAGRAAKERGIPSVVCQMDPGRFEIELVQEEAKHWPRWEADQLSVPEVFHGRRDEEWAVADRVICNSDWTRTALIEQGVPAEKTAVIPLCFEPPESNWQRPDKPTSEPLEVLWLGLVILRKGIQYLIEAAQQLLDENVRITVVGPVGISEYGLKSAPPNLRFTGAKPRSEVAEIYRSADVFVLPTISDGFAITQLEAMAYGLPVIATPNCGKVVVEGENGFITPARDADTLANRIGELVSDRDLLARMSEAARQTAGQFGVERLTRELTTLEESLCESV